MHDLKVSFASTLVRSARQARQIGRVDDARAKSPVMSLASCYLHKIDQCARLADDAEPCERDGFVTERQTWLRILAGEIGADVVSLETVLARCRWMTRSRDEQRGRIPKASRQSVRRSQPSSSQTRPLRRVD